ITLGNMLNIKQSVNVVSGKLDANSNLTLLSSPSGSASIATISSSATILGNVNVQSWFTGGSAVMRGTRTIAAPVNDGSTNSIYKQLQNYMLITGTGEGFDYPGAASIVTYNEPASIADGPAAQYNPVTNINDKLPAGRGFFLLYRGDRSQANNKLSPPYAIPESFAVTYQGPINQGNITVPLSFTNRTEHADDKAYNGYNLVGNPYPATIDWTLVGKTNTENLVSIIKPGGGMVTYSNGIVTNGGPAGTLTEDNTIIYSELPFIQSGQGFYVKAKGSGASITFTENSKAVNNAAARLLSVPQNLLASASRDYDLASSAKCVETTNEVLRINLQDSKNIDETAIVFKEGYSAEYGEGDATYFSGSSVSLYSLTSDGKNVAINFMPDIKEVTEMRLWVSATVSGPVKLNFTDFKGVGSHQVFLKDVYLDKLIDVKLKPVYEFNIDRDNTQTFGSERFRLLFRAPLLVTLKVKRINKGVELSYDNTSEIGSLRSLEIERSPDGKTFKTIGWGDILTKAANPVAIYVDENSLNGANYYRIKMSYLDGVVQHSESVQFNNILEKKGQVAWIYPNPANHKIYVLPNTFDEKNVRLVVYDLKGKKLLGGKGPSLEVAGLDKGIYLVELINAETNQQIGKTKFIKQ
ncbi:MAG TPA: T9SS type A sorting domain-containing protein, partial [Daejeonella sp.]|nr:T9SS type A sorting domain-containing protein [Daejeonella sp.]